MSFGVTQYDVYKLPERRTCGRPAHFWVGGVRRAPPCGRRIDELGVVRHMGPTNPAGNLRPRITGFPVNASPIWTASSESFFGYSRVGYRSAEIAMTEREAGKVILARLENTASGGHEAANKELAPEAFGRGACCGACDRSCNSGAAQTQ